MVQCLVRGDERYMAWKTGQSKITSTQGLIMSDPGHGKTTLLESMINSFIDAGGIVIVIHDPKKKVELGFCQFNPEDIYDYHQEMLDYYGIKSKRIKVKVWHPLTVNIPNKKIPEMQFFSFPLSSITTEDIIFLLESDQDKSNRELLTIAFSQLKKTDTIYEIMQKINAQMKRKELEKGNKFIPLPDPTRFGLLGVKVGTTIKELNKIYTSLQDWKQNPIWQPETSIYTFDPKLVFQSEIKLHIFSTQFIQNEKTDCFVTKKLLDYIVKTKKLYFQKGNVLIINDESLSKFSEEDSGIFYKQQLAKQYSVMLTRENRNNGISSATATHSLGSLNKTLLASNPFNWLIIGKTMAKKDREALRDYYRFTSEHMDTLSKLEKNQWMTFQFPSIPQDMSQNEGLRTIPPPFRHCEETEDYFTIFAKEYPERMVNYHFISEELKKNMEEIESQIGKEAVKYTQEVVDKIEKQDEEKKQKEIVKEQKREEKVAEIQAKEKTEEEKLKLQKDLYYMHYNKGMVYKELASTYGITESKVANLITKENRRREIQDLERLKEVEISDAENIFDNRKTEN